MDGNWKDLFSFNRRERNGILVLSMLILCLILVQFAIGLIPIESEEIDNRYLNAYVAQLQRDSAEWKSKNQYTKSSFSYAESKSPKVDKESVKKLKPNYFDPNIGTTEDWLSIGLNQGQIRSIKKFLDKGGEFRALEDVSKMYVIDDVQFERISPYMKLPEKKIEYKDSVSHTNEYKQTKKYKYDSIIVELNQSDTTELIKLRGIGSYYALQIVYYRDRLGGFYSVNQLYEVERMREETVQKILPFVTVDTNLITKIHVNRDKAAVMVKHPYITWNMAIKIQDQRDFGRKYKSVKELVDLGLLSEELYVKLVPYLEL